LAFPSHPLYCTGKLPLSSFEVEIMIHSLRYGSTSATRLREFFSLLRARAITSSVPQVKSKLKACSPTISALPFTTRLSFLVRYATSTSTSLPYILSSSEPLPLGLLPFPLSIEIETDLSSKYLPFACPRLQSIVLRASTLHQVQIHDPCSCDLWVVLSLHTTNHLRKLTFSYIMDLSGQLPCIRITDLRGGS
jgi:hypothetical protein